MANATMSRKDMERVIADGGSVLYGGRIISKVEDLPSAAALAAGNPDAAAKARRELEARLAETEAELERLRAAQGGGGSGDAKTQTPARAKKADDK